MADRKQTPDILGSLLGDKKPEDTSKPEYHKDSKPARQLTSKPVRQQARKTGRQPTSKTASQKLKATYYLDVEAVEALEEAWMQLRKMASTDTRSSISKSLIVGAALQIALMELEKAGQQSQIARRIIQK
jgi:hypothetical protein